MDEQGKTLEAANRKAQDASRDAVRKSQDTARQATRTAAEAATIGIETMGAWADANQQVTAQFVALSAETTKEFTRLYAHLQQSSFEMWRASQDEAFRWQSLWLQWSQQAFGESLKNAYRGSRMFNDTVAAVTESLERLQTTAEQTGREMQEVVSGTAGKLQELSSRAA
jgi:hypothetical protein